MTLFEQCEIWNEDNEFQNIIDALEAIPSDRRTPELDSELARAYNNFASNIDEDVEEIGVARGLFKKAIELLKQHEEYFEGDHNWNFRMGYAYYYLDQEGPAVRYFLKALEARPGDEDTQAFIDDCYKRLALPVFEKNFCQRTDEAWNAFEEIEEELRDFFNSDLRNEKSEELIAKCGEILEIAISNPSFEIGHNGDKCELILSADGLVTSLYKIVYFQHHAPESILENWNIKVGRQACNGFEFKTGDMVISGDDVQVWPEKKDNNRISLTMYCEKLVPLLEEDKNAWWMLPILTDEILGEIASIALIDGFDVINEPNKDGVFCMLSDLPKVLEASDMILCSDAEVLLDNYYSPYELEPIKDEDADWRFDIYVGATRMPALLSEYYNGETSIVEEYHADGAVVGFLFYPISMFIGDDFENKVLDFRDRLQESILDETGEDAVTFLGGATGISYGYVDLIAWDLPATLNAAARFFHESDLESASFAVFRRDVGIISLLDRSGEQDDDDYEDEVDDKQDDFEEDCINDEDEFDEI